ncbi:MAG: AI-2E family transporter [Pyrinomonadaceae bacterium]
MKDQVNQARWLAVLAATTIALYLCWLMLRPFIGVLEWAAVLVIVFYPAHKQLAKKIRRPGLSALVSCLLVIVIVVLPLIFLTMALANELASAIQDIPGYIAKAFNMQAPVIGKVSRWIHDRVLVDSLRSQEFIVDQLKSAAGTLLGQSLGLMGNIVGGIVKAFFIVFTMYYLFRDGDKIVNALPAALPLNRKQSEAILVRTREVVSASVYGVVTIAMIQGLLGGLAFWALGIPSPVLWAVLMTFVCMIPIASSLMVWLPLSFYLILNGHVTKAVLLITWGVLVVSTIDNFLRPKLIRNQTKLHELFVFFSVLGGISVFGLLGIVLGPVVLAITLGLLHTFKQDDNEGPETVEPERLTLQTDGELSARAKAKLA